MKISKYKISWGWSFMPCYFGLCIEKNDSFRFIPIRLFILIGTMLLILSVIGMTR